MSSPAPSKTLIFSDAHLKAVVSDKARHRTFARFLRRFAVPEFERIICVGDLFDFWFEYKSVIFSEYFEVLRAFAELRDQGKELHLICGNHDFWAGRFLQNEIGFHIHPDRAQITLGRFKALVIHGDGIEPTDYAYRAYKRVARNPLVVWLFRQIHPDWAMGLARSVSYTSRRVRRVEDTANSAQAAALRKYATQVIARGDADIVVCAHAHAPTLEWIEDNDRRGVYINSGDWLERGAYVVWDGTTFSLYWRDPEGVFPAILQSGVHDQAVLEDILHPPLRATLHLS